MKRGFALLELVIVIGAIVFALCVGRIARVTTWYQLAGSLFVLIVLLAVVRLRRLHRESRIDPGPSGPRGFDVVQKDKEMKRSEIAAVHRRAFSLIEVMVSIAMVLIIMFGVVKVFTYSANTISTGLASAEVTRAARSLQTAFPVDLQLFQRLDSSITSQDASPALMIVCERNDPTVANGSRFATAEDQAEHEATYGVGGAMPTGSTTAAERNRFTFRTDTLGFFARGAFRRQTANKGSLAADSGMSSPQAFIQYGHLWLPDNTGAYTVNTLPGAGDKLTNPNNWLASKRTLGRVIMGLRSRNYPLPPAVGAYSQLAAGTTVQDHYQVTAGSPMSPLGVATQSTMIYDTIAPYAIQESRYDVAAMDTSAILPPLTPDPFGYFRTRVTSPIVWWTELDYRFEADPFPTKPFDASQMGIAGGSAKMARTFPIFLPNCSDFIVEFAGDFNGDGRIDEITPPEDGVAKTQWYGLPRDSDGNGSLDVVAPAGTFVRSSATSRLVCAWGGESALATTPAANARPMMLRITCVIRDANGRLADGRPYETIVKLN